MNPELKIPHEYISSLLEYMNTHNYNKDKVAQNGLAKKIQNEMDLPYALGCLESINAKIIELTTLLDNMRKHPSVTNNHINTNHINTNHINTNHTNHINIIMDPSTLMNAMLQTFNKSIKQRGGIPINMSDINVPSLQPVTTTTIHDNMELLAEHMHDATKQRNNGAFPQEAIDEIKQGLVVFEKTHQNGSIVPASMDTTTPARCIGLGGM